MTAIGRGSPFRRFARSLSGFTLSMLLMAAVALFTIPAMISSSGAFGWAAIATGQAIGTISSIFVAYGWGLTGPSRIRAIDVDNLVELAESLRVRLSLLAPCAVAAALVSYLISPQYPWFAAVAAASTTLVGLSSTWYFAGTRESGAYLVTEVLPRTAGSLLGILAMTRGSSALVGVSLHGAGLLAGFVVSTCWILSQLRDGRRVTRLGRPVRTLLATHSSGLASQIVLGLYAALPVAIVGVASPATQPTFAIIDRVQKQVNAALSPVVTTIQGFTPASNLLAAQSKVRYTLRMLPVAAGVLAVAVLLFGPRLLEYLSTGSIAVSPVQTFLMAMMVGATFALSVVVRACLPALRLTREGVRRIAIGSSVGLVSVVGLGYLFGATGALVGVVGGQTISLIFVLWGLRSVLRR